MINAYQEIRQDTIQITNAVLNDSIKGKTDTTSVCTRNSIADITFHDSVNVLTTIDPSLIYRFPLTFIENNQIREAEARSILIKQLKPGQILPENPLKADWTLLILLIASVLYSLILNTSKSLLPELSKFFLFRGVSDSSSRDIGGMFHSPISAWAKRTISI